MSKREKYLRETVRQAESLVAWANEPTSAIALLEEARAKLQDYLQKRTIRKAKP